MRLILTWRTGSLAELFALVALTVIGLTTPSGQLSQTYFASAFSFSNSNNNNGILRVNAPHKSCVSVHSYYSSQQRTPYCCRTRNNPFTVVKSFSALRGQQNLIEDDHLISGRLDVSTTSLTLAENSIIKAADDHNNTSSSKSNTDLDNVTKTLNALLLAASFGWALYTILRVDEGMTRGWTQQEIMMRIPIDNWRTYEYNLNASPIETKTFINVIIYLLGDWLSQTIFQKKNILDFDASRTLKNGFIGLCFGPLVHQYYEFSDRILPLDVDINRLYKIIMDQTIYLAVKCSIYIVAVGLLSGSTLQESIDNVKNRIKTVMLTAWSFWPLVHCVTYTVIPARHRILWVNCVDLVWNAILATKARAPTSVDETAAAMAPVATSSVEIIKEKEDFVSNTIADLQPEVTQTLHVLPATVSTESAVAETPEASVAGDSIGSNIAETSSVELLHGHERVTTNSIAELNFEAIERLHILSTKVAHEDVDAKNSDENETSSVKVLEQEHIMDTPNRELLVEAKATDMLHISPANVYMENAVVENPQAFVAVDVASNNVNERANTILFQNQTSPI